MSETKMEEIGAVLNAAADLVAHNGYSIASDLIRAHAHEAVDALEREREAVRDQCALFVEVNTRLTRAQLAAGIRAGAKL